MECRQNCLLSQTEVSARGRAWLLGVITALHVERGCLEGPCLVIVGAHGSAKSTLGRALAGALGWEFHHELGEVLRLRRLARDLGAHALLAQEEFDAELMGLELARDGGTRGPCPERGWGLGLSAAVWRLCDGGGAKPLALRGG